MRFVFAWVMALLLTATLAFASHLPQPPVSETITLRAFGVPAEFKFGPADEVTRQVIRAFCERYPHVNPVSAQTLQIPGSGQQENLVPLMQIAGDVAPDVMYVNFKQSHSYIQMKLLYPLDRYLEELAGVTLEDGSAMGAEEYVATLENSPRGALITDRVLPQCWPVIRRICPYELECPYRDQWQLAPLREHRHVWAYPVGPLVMGLMYNRALFAEHAHEGIEQRAPRDWEELMRWAKVLTNPQANQYGIKVQLDLPSWQYLSFLYSAGGEVVQQNEHDEWHCVLDSEAAVEAAYFYARLKLEKINPQSDWRGVIGSSSATAAGLSQFGMEFEYLDDRFLGLAPEQNKGVGPVPAGPTGLRRSEFNAMMCGIFAGLADEQPKRDAAWNYIAFYDGPEARRIRTEKMVEAGLGRYVRPKLLRQFNTDGRYDSVLRQVSPELEETYRIAFEGGVPEPYGKNCQWIYEEMNKPIGAIWNSAIVREAIDSNRPEMGKAEIRQILRRATQRINEKMLGELPPQTRQKRHLLAWVVIALVVALFVWIFRRIFKTFRPPDELSRGGLQLGRYRYAYLLMAPALLSIALWMYWPMARGTLIAFQDYSVMGDSQWVGAGNFASVLFNGEFWYSLKISILYALLFLLFGFWTPIALAFLLQEIPTGKTLFRTIYYLPALLSGVVVIFLWKNFYGTDGLINEILNGVFSVLNLLPFVDLNPIHQNWLESPTTALFFTLLPTIWAGMGPGCLIYLAALKTVPEEIYEAADLDGAGISRKIFSVALPSIRALVMINFIGAIIGAVRGSAAYVLAMTGGGPYGEHGGATEVVGLKIFYTTFGYLQFGVGAAMAWVLGAMLIGFTVIQLQRLSRLEFRTAEKVG